MDVRNFHQDSNSFLLKNEGDFMDSWESNSTASQNSDEKSDSKPSPPNGCNGNVNSLTCILKAKQEFHSRRFLRFKHLPSDVTEQDIRQLVHPLEIKDVQLNRISQTAKVIPMLPESLEVWPAEKEYSLRDHKVLVTPSSTDGMLCVAHLPLIYTEQEFSNLVQMYGPVARCFLLRSEKTGEYKGYGFVEYSSKEVAYKAKGLLDKKCIGDCTLHCNWLDSAHMNYSSLHSKCLFVDHLPPNYRDLVEFRKIFSVRISPSYCQIALKNGQPLGFGLVEFENPVDAEDTQMQLNHYQIDEYKIRVTYCIPGYRAMVIYNKLTSELASNGKKPLLPDPPTNSTAYGQLQMLALQNPQLFQNLQNMVSSQLSNGSSSRNGFDEKMNGVKSPQSHHVSGLMGSVPSPDTSPSSTTSCSSVSSSSTSAMSQGQMNPNVQAALVLLLATQMQFQMGVQQPSLLGNPQLLSLVQTFLKQQIGLKDTANGLQNVMTLLQNNGQSQAPTAANNVRKSSSEPNAVDAGMLPNNRKMWVSPSINGNGDWTPQGRFPQKQNGTGPVQYKTHKVPLLPNPPMSTKCETGLLPTPDSGKSGHLLGSTRGGTKSVGALHNGHSKYHQVAGGLLETPNGCSNQLVSKGSLLGPKPASTYNGHGQKVPLLGDKPGAVPIHNSATNGCHQPLHNGGSQNQTDDVCNNSQFVPAPPLSSHANPHLPDTNATLQQILPFILSQSQLFFNGMSKSKVQPQAAPQLNPMASAPSPHQQQLQSQQQHQLRNLSPPVAQNVTQNHTIPLSLNPTNPNGNGLIFGNVPAGPMPSVAPQHASTAQLAAFAQLQQQLQIQGMTPALMSLLLQMSHGANAAKNCGDGRQPIHPPNIAPQQTNQQLPHKNGFQSHNGYSQVNGHLGNLLPPSPGKMLFQNHLPPVTTLMALSNGKSPPIVGFPPSPFLVPAPQPNPPNVTQLMAEIQQRGSLLGDFWQAAQREIPTLYGAPGNGKIPIASPAVTNLGSPLNGKRKLHVLLPTPESSPEGCFVGQNSQGLAGHYAESYRKKRHI